MGCKCNKNKSNIFSAETKKRLLDYIQLDKNIIGNMECDEPSDYDKFVMQHDTDIQGALLYIEELEKRLIDEININCGNEAKINKLEERLESSEQDYNKVMEINSNVIKRNNILVEENDNLKRYIDDILDKNKSKIVIKNPNETSEEFYKKVFENVPVATIQIDNKSTVTISTGQDKFNKEIIDVIETITESVDDCYIPTTLAKLRELQKQIELSNGRKFQ